MGGAAEYRSRDIKPIKYSDRVWPRAALPAPHCAVRNRARFTVLSEVGTGASQTATIISTRHVAQRVVADGYRNGHLNGKVAAVHPGRSRHAAWLLAAERQSRGPRRD
jgi:hypothetical protein